MPLLLITIDQLLVGWNDFFFSEAPTLTICVVRALTGLLVLLQTFDWSRAYRLLLAPDGWFGLESFQQFHRHDRFTLLQYLPASKASIVGLLMLQGIAGFCLTTGVLPQAAALVAFLTLVSIHNRNPYALHSGDTVCRYLCLFLVFAPSGNQLSLLHPGALLQAETTGWPWTLFMIRFFMANIYLKNVLFKLMGTWWRDGTATQKVFNVHLWIQHPVPRLLNRTWFYRATTWGTLLMETALFTLIWIEAFRLPVVVSGMLFHLGLWYFLRVRFFQIAMIVGLAAFITPEEYAVLFRWLLP